MFGGYIGKGPRLKRPDGWRRLWFSGDSIVGDHNGRNAAGIYGQYEGENVRHVALRYYGFLMMIPPILILLLLWGLTTFLPT